ncbi:MAG: efflux RND transporter permease subunit [Clostridiales bacterium]|nr:efflux RND transporter permease subunit [Clostridiales bacterium]
MLPKTSIKRPVTTIMILLMTILAGFIGLSGLKMDLMPSIDIPIAIVSTTYVGAGPEEIENMITKPIEEALGSVSNVDKISSTSSANSSMVTVQFVDGTDIDMAAVDMREKIDLIKSTLPDDAEEPMVLKLDINDMSSIMIGIGSDSMDIPDLTQFADDNIVKVMEKIDGVASVNTMGGLDQVVNITVDQEKMDGYGITTSKIASVLQQENMNVPSGKIKNGTTKITARTVGKFQSVNDIKNILITTAGGSTVRLSDVANVELTTEEENSYVLVNGEKSIIISLSKQSDANMVEVSDLITKQMDKLNEKYPQVHLKMLSDTSDYIKTSVNNVLSTAIQAAIMAIIVLFVFLRSFATSGIIAVSIPTSVIATFAAMWACDMTLNTISLGGITIGIGMLVDNSVVVLENIYKYHSKGYSARDAAEQGAREVGLSVMASTLTTVAVFIPLMFVSGTIGQMFKDLSLTVCFSLFASLIVSLSFVPMACSQLLDKEDHSKPKSSNPFSKFLDAWGKGLDKIDATYRGFLEWVLHRKKRTIVVVFVIFLASMGLLPIVGFDLMPEMDQGSLSISIEMPSGTVVEETTKIVDEVLSRTADIEETEDVYVITGDTAGMISGNATADEATISINLVDKEDRDRSTDEVVADIKERLKSIPGADITVAASNSAMGSYSAATDLEVQINGEDTDVLRQIGNDLKLQLMNESWATDVETSAEDAELEANIVIDREKAAQYGISTAAVANALSTAISGSTATTYKVGDTDIDIDIKQDEDKISYIKDFQKITVMTNEGQIIPLTEVAKITTDEASTSITRNNNHRYVTIGCNLVDLDAASGQQKMNELLNNYEWPEGYDYEYTGDMETMVDTFTSLLLALVVAVLLVYMIMASQFESYVYPFIVMFSVPLAITGAIFGLFITGNHVTSTTFMGFIMLVGMVVNNAIVLIDYTNQLRDRGMSCNEALIAAGPSRLRPILMTTLTTVIGMVPMALAIGEGTEMQQPMAIAIIFGLSISTLVTLVFIPVLYSSFEVFRLRRKKRKMMKKEEKKDVVVTESNTED